MRRGRTLLGICLAVWVFCAAAESSAQGILNNVWFKVDLTMAKCYTTPAPPAFASVWTPWTKYSTTVYVRFTGGPNVYSAPPPQVYSQNTATPGTFVANTAGSAQLTLLGPNEDLIFGFSLSFNEQADDDTFGLMSQGIIAPIKIRRNGDGSFRSATLKTAAWSMSSRLDGGTSFLLGNVSVKAKSIDPSRLPFTP
jgi:hypothetical protein